MRDILYVKIMFLVEKVFLYLRFAPNLPLVYKDLIIQLTIILFELNFELFIDGVKFISGNIDNQMYNIFTLG